VVDLPEVGDESAAILAEGAGLVRDMEQSGLASPAPGPDLVRPGHAADLAFQLSPQNASPPRVADLRDQDLPVPEKNVHLPAADAQLRGNLVHGQKVNLRCAHGALQRARARA
jgi:hypothetical protein